MNTPKHRTGRNLVQLGNAVSWFRNQKFLLIGLTSSQSEVMRYVLKNQKESITAGDLIAQLGLSQSTVAGIIKRLEKKNLLMRCTDDSDARKSIIVPTDDGLRIEKYLKEVAAQTEEVLLQGMTEAEQDELNRLLKIALNNINTYRALNPDEVEAFGEKEHADD